MSQTIEGLLVGMNDSTWRTASALESRLCSAMLEVGELVNVYIKTFEG